MNIAIIPARGGSKRIPRKNIKLFHGKPMIAYSIEAAIKSGCFDKVIVSTDDAEIADVAQQFGAQVPFMRPADIADDYATTLDVMKHALEWLEAQGDAVDNVCCLYATAPFVLPSNLKQGYEALQSGELDYAFSATSYAFPIQRALKLNAEGTVEMFQPEHFNTRSQDLIEAYHDAGQFYWGTADAFKAKRPIFGVKSKAVLLPRKQVQDIDTPEDWDLAEALFQVIKC
ncbi:pseudaminic acid cytidylyltransferase [Pseudoalteromonas lipolytica]|uniref:Pseudaminic acid cytidylyltransferase n=1 Tax=Pseudoalteromonas lipolytica TaxID=570156 RepID=A0AAD0S1W9_9GAMM|nr:MULTISPECIES: pseudaminic acid cytidylyltransferase [Pseudoalteromonas]AXV66482.1 pseudaminic acid cytidylyltransferase [Pseudoalteromonas donghaensis]MCC9661782.1 pseudaminic acid cytidylyltransferase [Pseudoalteromonas sp. MB41]